MDNTIEWLLHPLPNALHGDKKVNENAIYIWSELEWAIYNVNIIITDWL